MENQIPRIVDLRQSGLSWKQVEEIVFPGNDLNHHPHKSWVLAKKHNATGAFEKRVVGAFTPTQVVERLRQKIVPMPVPMSQVVEMFI